MSYCKVSSGSSDCGPLPSTKGSSTTQGNQVTIDSIVKYTCIYGDAFYVTCQEDGTWSEVSTCLKGNTDNRSSHR